MTITSAAAHAAKDLHDLYSPLPWLNYPRIFEFDHKRPDDGWWCAMAPSGFQRVPTEVAAAHFRTKAEDWLIPRVYAMRWRQFDNPKERRTWFNLELTHHDGSFDTFEGDTPHHALVAAVEAVAASKANPAPPPLRQG